MGIVTLDSIKRPTPLPPRTLLYGTHGVGKTSLAASASSPIFIQTEDGLGTIDAPSFGLLRSYDEVMQAIGALYEGDHSYQTVVLDSLDWLEPLVWAQTARDNGWANIEQAGYGKGYVAADDHWRAILDGFNALRVEKGMGVILIAHSEIRRFNSPETEPYDRYLIKLHTRANSLVQEHVDCIFFVNYRVSTVKTDAGFNKKVVRGVGAGQRVVHTEERPAFVAKTRYRMPDTIDLPGEPGGWPLIEQHMTSSFQATA